MNLDILNKELNFLKYYSNDFKAILFDKLQNYEIIFKQFCNIHNISNFKTLEPQIIDSLKILDFKSFNIKNAIDIGSGAGFPAVFLSLILKTNFHLFEPNLKKNSFLNLIKSKLNIDNLYIYKDKIEKFNKQFIVDLITSRACMSIQNLIALSEGFFDERTLFLFYKGSNLDKELNIIKDYKIFNYKQRKYCIIKDIYANYRP